MRTRLDQSKSCYSSAQGRIGWDLCERWRIKRESMSQFPTCWIHHICEDSHWLGLGNSYHIVCIQGSGGSGVLYRPTEHANHIPTELPVPTSLKNRSLYQTCPQRCTRFLFVLMKIAFEINTVFMFYRLHCGSYNSDRHPHSHLSEETNPYRHCINQGIKQVSALTKGCGCGICRPSL